MVYFERDTDDTLKGVMMLDCGHPDECWNDEDCTWCDEIAALEASLGASAKRNRQLLESEKRRAIRLGPGSHSLGDTPPIGLLLVEKGAVVTLDTDGATLEWVDVNGGTFNAGRSDAPTPSTITQLQTKG